MAVDKTKRCIIADDVRASRELLGTWLTELGYVCTLVADGEAARVAAEETGTDLIITDIEMPKCNGLELLKAIRSHANAELRTLPIIVVSSLCDEQLAELVGKLGATCVLSKPLEKLRLKMLLDLLDQGPESLQSMSHVQLQPDIPSLPAVSPKLRRMVEEVSRDTI